MVLARKATPVSLGLMKRRSVGRSHAHRITRGIGSSRAAVAAAELLLITERAFVNAKARAATSMVVPTTARISFLDCLWFMSRNCNRKAASVHQEIMQKKSLCAESRTATVNPARILCCHGPRLSHGGPSGRFVERSLFCLPALIWRLLSL